MIVKEHPVPQGFTHRQADGVRQNGDGGVSRVHPWRWRIAISSLVVLVGIAGLVVHSDSFKARVLARIAGSYSERADAYSFLRRHCDVSRTPVRSLRACEKFVAMRPTDAYAHVLLGEVYAGLGRTSEAIGSYRRAIELDPSCFDAHLGLGKAQFSLGCYSQAVESYGVALRIKPDSAEVHLSLGLTLSNSGQYEEAMQAFQKARELDPHISDAQVLTGKVYLDDGMCAQAIECFKGAVTADHEHAQAYYNLGKAYLRIGDTALAIEQHRSLERLDPQLANRLLHLIEQ